MFFAFLLWESVVATSYDLPMHLRLLTITMFVVFASACGQKAKSSDDAAPIVDAVIRVDGSPDAKPPCLVGNYPQAAGSIDVTLDAPFTLTLDGNGERCAQLVRALLSTTARPMPLLAAETDFTLKSCEFDSVLNADIVRLGKNTFAGAPLYSSAQDLLIHVRRVTNNVTFLAGRILPTNAGTGSPSPCIAPAEALTSIVGMSFSYQQFLGCRLGDVGNYQIAADDDISIGAQGWYVDNNDKLHRAYIAPVYLLPSHTNSAIINSDAFCCIPEQMLRNCVGTQLVIDAVTGTTLGQNPNCHTC
jgi:hypothetical protein